MTNQKLFEIATLIKQGNKDYYPFYPKGILIHGNQNVGKSLLVKKFVKKCNLPIFELKNFANEDIDKLFKEAMSIDSCIIHIDKVEEVLELNSQLASTLINFMETTSEKQLHLIVLTSTDKSKIPQEMLS